MPPSPQVKAFLLCANIEEGVGAHGLKLEGPFTLVYGRRFPLMLENCFLFVRLADGLGKYDVSVRLLHVDSQELLAFTDRTSFSVPDRLLTKDFVMETGEILLPWSGRYEVQLWLGERSLHTATFDAVAW